ncbi:MAG: glycosyltransferase [Coriobacteriales bacterium]|jgi:glycosyltransferase involved in cell wall biosynthesis|nr:glycosyltransferase [Coriobacteriales bacterium]
MGAFISVIVPVYNAEGSLGTCLDALVSQEGVRLQIIAIDDGSTDASGRILDAYAAQNPDMVVVHTKNQGVGKARLEGLTRVQGDYVGFCDSGDRPDRRMYALLLDSLLAASAEMAVCGFERINVAGGQRPREEMLGFASKSLVLAQDPALLLALNTAVWNKLFKARLITQAILNFTFPRVGEDLLLQLLLCQQVTRVSFVDQPLYHYYVQDASLMSGVTGADFDQLRLGLLELKNHIVRTTNNQDLLAVCDISAFVHLGLSFPLRLATTEDQSLPRMIRQTRKVLKRDFPLYATSDLCSLATVLRHRGRTFKLFAARLCYKLRLATFLVWFLRLSARYGWLRGYW